MKTKTLFFALIVLAVVAWMVRLIIFSNEGTREERRGFSSAQIDSLRVEISKVEEGDFVRMGGRWYRVEENRKDKDFTLAVWVLPNGGKSQSIFLAFPEDVLRVDKIARKNVEPRLWYEAEAQFLNLPMFHQ